MVFSLVFSLSLDFQDGVSFSIDVNLQSNVCMDVSSFNFPSIDDTGNFCLSETFTISYSFSGINISVGKEVSIPVCFRIKVNRNCMQTSNSIFSFYVCTISVDIVVIFSLGNLTDVNSFIVGRTERFFIFDVKSVTWLVEVFYIKL